MVKLTLNALDRDLKLLAEKVEEMGSIAVQKVTISIDAVFKNDREFANSTITIDKQLDVLYRQIQEDAFLVIARRQPISVNLREILGAIRISGDLERIGYLANNIAQRVKTLSDEQRLPIEMNEFRRQANFSTLQIKDALDAYVRRDEQRAEAVWLRRIQVSEGSDLVENKLISVMIENPRRITPAKQFLFISKNLEYISDKAVNIAKAVHYMVTDEVLPFDQEN